MLDLKFKYQATGAGSHVYIVDSGIRSTHEEFEGRVGQGIDIYDQDNDPEDCHGHGTHVASLIAGRSHGVAPDAIVHAVRVIPCYGEPILTYTSDIIAAFDWIAENHISPAVANLSLSLSVVSQVLSISISHAAQSGVLIVVSAGNTANTVPCNYTLKSHVDTIAVAALDALDEIASFSTTGECIDIIAPGSGVLGASNQSDTQMTTKDGTSMAAGFVSGAAALYMESFSGINAQDFREILQNEGTSIPVNVGNSAANRVVYAYVPLLLSDEPPATQPKATSCANTDVACKILPVILLLLSD